MQYNNLHCGRDWLQWFILLYFWAMFSVHIQTDCYTYFDPSLFSMGRMSRPSVHYFYPNQESLVTLKANQSSQVLINKIQCNACLSAEQLLKMKVNLCPSLQFRTCVVL